MRFYNVTGLYKHQRDRQPAKRSRRAKSAGTPSPFVEREAVAICPECGFGTDTDAHRIYLCTTGQCTTYPDEAPPVELPQSKEKP